MLMNAKEMWAPSFLFCVVCSSTKLFIFHVESDCLDDDWL